MPGRSTVRTRLAREPHLEVVVGDEARESLVVLDALGFPRLDIDPIDLVVLRIALVDGAEDLRRVLRADRLDASVDALPGSEVLALLALDVDPVDVPLFVAVLVL